MSERIRFICGYNAVVTKTATKAGDGYLVTGATVAALYNKWEKLGFQPEYLSEHCFAVAKNSIETAGGYEAQEALRDLARGSTPWVGY